MAQLNRLLPSRNHDDERGANLVEFAIVMPFLVLLLLGIVEFGWVFSQNNDIRHGAREGARAAAVNIGDNNTLHTSTCDSMDLTSTATVKFEDSASGAVGEVAAVQVVASPNSLSGLGLIEAVLPSTLTSTIEFRLEQPSSLWSTDGSAYSCP